MFAKNSALRPDIYPNDAPEATTFYANGDGTTWTQHFDLRGISHNLVIQRNDGLKATHLGGPLVHLDLPDFSTLQRRFPEITEEKGDIRAQLAQCLDSHYPINKAPYDPHAYLYA